MSQNLTASLFNLLIADAEQRVPLQRTHIEQQPVADIVFDPSENYRWGSEAAMRGDINRKMMVNDDGTKGSSYDAMKASIREIGVQEPVGLVMRDDGLHIIYGFTRVLCCRELGIENLPAYIYSSDISESDVELLQTRENSRNLRREVNWVAEVEMYTSLWGALFVKRCEAAGIELTDGKRAASERKLAKEAVCRTLGRHPSRMKSAEHFLRVLDSRVLDLAREGRIDYLAAQEFHSGDVDNPFKPSKITAILQCLKGREGYPDIISAPKVRQAKRTVDMNFDRAVDTVSDVDVGEEPNKGPEVRGASAAPMNRANRVEEKTIAAKGESSSATHIMRGAERIRTSSAQLRDLADLVAWDALIDAGLSIKSAPEKVERIIGSAAWHKVLGISWGADTVAMPPLMEVILGGKSVDDPDIERMQRQHDHSAERFVVTAFVRALIRQAMADNGVRNLDYDDKGWISGRSPKEGGEGNVHHRDLFTQAVQHAVTMPGDVTLVARAQHVWSKIRPYVKAKAHA